MSKDIKYFDETLPNEEIDKCREVIEKYQKATQTSDYAWLMFLRYYGLAEEDKILNPLVERIYKSTGVHLKTGILRYVLNKQYLYEIEQRTN